MRKNRNAFFAENNANFEGYNPMFGNMPYQSASQSSSFYSGGMMPNVMHMDNNEYSERLAKLERQVARLEHRISKLEASSAVSTDDYESTTNNMYIL